MPWPAGRSIAASAVPLESPSIRRGTGSSAARPRLTDSSTFVSSLSAATIFRAASVGFMPLVENRTGCIKSPVTSASCFFVNPKAPFRSLTPSTPLLETRRSSGRSALVVNIELPARHDENSPRSDPPNHVKDWTILRTRLFDFRFVVGRLAADPQTTDL